MSQQRSQGMTEAQLAALKELATTAAEIGHSEQTYWPRACLQLIEELEAERAEWRRERGLE